MLSEKRVCLAVVRVRGVIGAPRDIKETLKMLNLKRNCNCVLIDNRPSYIGMLRKSHNYVTWGEVSKETIALLLKKRGRLVGGKKLTDEFAEKIGYKTLDALAEAIFEGKVEYGKLSGVNPVFRLHPPSKGFKGKIKRSYAAGGVTGYRGAAVNELIKRMA